MSHDVFVSYSSEDNRVADSVCTALELGGLKCWIAPRNVPSGVQYAEAIMNAIIDCRVVVVIFSSNANRSVYIEREVERAVSRRKMVVPFRIENIAPSGAMEYWLGNTHWLEAVAPPVEARIEELRVAVARLLSGSSSAPQNADVDAVKWASIPDDASFEVISEVFEKLPRPAKLLFLSACAERVAPLFTAACPRLLIYSYQRELYKATDLIEKYLYNPYTVERKALELAKENAKTATVAASCECKSDKASLAVDAAITVEMLLEAAIQPDAERFTSCFKSAYLAMLVASEDQARTLINRTLVHDLNMLHTAIREHGWHDHSTGVGLLLRPVWPFGKPERWPNESLPFAAEVLKGTIANLTGYKLIKKLFD